MVQARASGLMCRDKGAWGQHSEAEDEGLTRDAETIQLGLYFFLFSKPIKGSGDT